MIENIHALAEFQKALDDPERLPPPAKAALAEATRLELQAAASRLEAEAAWLKGRELEGLNADRELAAADIRAGEEKLAAAKQAVALMAADLERWPSLVRSRANGWLEAAITQSAINAGLLEFLPPWLERARKRLGEMDAAIAKFRRDHKLD